MLQAFRFAYRFFLLTLALSRTLLAESTAPAAGSQNQVVAIVNSEVITMLDVIQTLPPRPPGLAEEDWLKLRFQFFKDRLKSLIERKLLYQEAKLANIELAQEEIDGAIEVRWRRGFKTKEEFLDNLKRMNMTFQDFREQVIEDLMARALIQRRIQFDSSISKKELLAYFDEHLSDYTVKEKRKLSILQIPQKLESGEDGESLASSLVKRLKEKVSDFESLARTHSIGPGASAGGDWGWKEPQDLIEPLRAVAFKLQVGQISDVVPTRVGYFILKADAAVPGKMEDFEQAQSDIRQKLQSQRFYENRVKLVEELTLRGYVVPFPPNPELLR